MSNDLKTGRLAMDCLKYPFDSQMILRKKKQIRRELLASNTSRIQKKIAILGGSSTAEIKNILELFLLDNGIEPSFYESDYGQYWQDAMFGIRKLEDFRPDIVFIHTTARNINIFPEITDTSSDVERKLTEVFDPFRQMWEKLAETLHCPIIQNNFEKLWFRLMGNRDIWDFHGRGNFISRLNEKFYAYAGAHDNFFINDIDYLSACFGLDKWNDPYYWHMYKYAPALPAVPEFAFNLANIIKSIYGKNKKALVLDLDNTIWGGVIGDDGPDHIEIGQETPLGQLYSEFQLWLKEQKSFGTLLTVDSKNSEDTAIAGLSRPDSILKPEDFQVIKANWEPKDRNYLEIAAELNIGTDAMVFVDDNPAERHLVRSQVPDTDVPEIGEPQDYLIRLDRSGFFERTDISDDDLHRNEMYRANAARARQEAAFSNYKEYLLSLEMKAEIMPFSSLYLPRIAQLTNKSNQFNLTTRRCTESELSQIASDPDCITLYGKLEDRFGDNGVVSVVFGHRDRNVFHIDLWLMSCRVLKKNMEFAMMDELVRRCQAAGTAILRGYYYPTKKNRMVKDFYGLLGFSEISADADGNTVWELDISDGYQEKNDVIQITGEQL